MHDRHDDTLAYQDLQPDDILAAVETLGVRCDGRLLPLNSYENRVYQVGLEDGGPVVAKFYRPGRWSDAAIQEEHDFAAELAERDVPVVAPLRRDGRSLHRHAAFRFSVSPRVAGREPELDDYGLLRQVGRLLGRLHLCGETRRFGERSHLTPDRLGAESCEFLLRQGFLPDPLRPAGTCSRLSDTPGAPSTPRAFACTAISTRATSWSTPARCASWTWTTAAPARQSRISGCSCRATGRSRNRSWRSCSPATSSSAVSTWRN
jgi:hypothetical protein